MDEDKKSGGKIEGERSTPWRLWRVSGIDGHKIQFVAEADTQGSYIVSISAASIGTTRPIITGCPSKIVLSQRHEGKANGPRCRSRGC